MLLSSAQIFAETVTISADRYRLKIDNNVEVEALKVPASDVTTTLSAGMYVRWTLWDEEILCDFDISSIPQNALITKVDFEYNVQSITGPAMLTSVKIYRNTREWSGIPKYNHFTYTPWPQEDILFQENDIAAGIRTVTASGNFKNLVQGWIDIPSSNKGIILTNNPAHYTYRIDVSTVKIIVEYTTGVTPDDPDGKDFKVTPLLSYFAAYAEENVLITNQSGIHGRVGTSEYGDVTVEGFSSVKGDIYSGGDLTARNYCSVDNTDDVSGVIKEQTPTLEFNPGCTHDDVVYGGDIHRQ